VAPLLQGDGQSDIGEAGRRDMSASPRHGLEVLEALTIGHAIRGRPFDGGMIADAMAAMP